MWLVVIDFVGVLIIVGLVNILFVKDFIFLGIVVENRIVW